MRCHSKISANRDGMLRAISFQVTRKVEAGYNPSYTTESKID